MLLTNEKQVQFSKGLKNWSVKDKKSEDSRLVLLVQ